MIGTKLGRWVIDRHLGRGAMGTVYHAHADDAPEEVRAIKILAPELVRDAMARRRFQRETEVLCQLDHPNIVRFDGSGVEGDILYYVMEFVDGPDCESRLQEVKRFPWWDVLDLMIQVAQGLKYAHDQGIVHRDLKPANILLAKEKSVDASSSRFTAKIADFGVARVFSQGALTSSGQFIGTALYMAPEQAAGKPATKRSDFYALGCVAYTLLTGRPPFNGTSFAEMVHKHQFAQAERPARLIPDLPYEIDDLVMRLLAKDPAARPADGSVLLRQLESLRGKLMRKHNIADTVFMGQESRNRSSIPWNDPSDTNQAPPTIDWNKIVRGIVLTVALIVVVGLIVYKFSQSPPTAEELFQKASVLMASPHPDDWEKAWNDYLDPLLRRYPNHPYQREIEAFRQRRQEATVIRRINQRQRSGAPRSEAQRFLELSLARIQAGDTTGARPILKALIDAFAAVESESHWVRLAENALQELPERPPHLLDQPEIQAALQKARQWADTGERDKAETIWSGLETLYREQPNSDRLLEAIKAERAKRP
jgi:serine/threonine protein kinase